MTTNLPQATPGMFASPIPLSAPFVAGLENARWPGRCQQIIDPARDGTRASVGKTTWFLDGAHTVESLKACAEWFTSPGVAHSTIQAGEVSDARSR
jgi:folylpolyglutamate synthase